MSREHWVKYCRTKHLPWSQGYSEDDVRLADVSQFEGHEVIISEKLDGENTTIYNDGFHARSLDSKSHASRDWLASFWAQIRSDIPEGWRICGENLYAKHAIYYENLDSYFYGFSIWDENNICLSYDETIEWFKLIGITHVPVLYRGIFNEEKIKKIQLDTEKQEGYVIRKASAFSYDDFNSSVAKWVRPKHVQPNTKFWFLQEITPNKLKKL